MLALLFSVGANRYALAARDVIEVVPLVQFRPVPKAPPSVVGVFNYRGVITPAIDMRLALEGVASSRMFSTRILIVKSSNDDEVQPLGLIVERASDAVSVSPDDTQPSGVTSADAPYLKEIFHYEGEMVQRVDPLLLLPESVRITLFQDIKENAAIS
ncbi:chemotaxis protein CheW [bacterium]|nr:chemotaxis protein CheW [bacterium]